MTDIPQYPSGTNCANPVSASTQTTVRLEPHTENIIVPTPWYKQLFGGPVYRTQTVWKLTFLALLIVGVIVGQSLVQSPSTIVTKAAVGVAKVSLFPNDTVMIADKQFQLWFTIDKPMKEATIVVKFNPHMIQLSDHLILLPEKNYTVIVSPKTVSNQTGQIEIKLLPDSGAEPISEGTSQVASLFFTAVKDKSGLTEIAIDEEITKILTPDLIQFSISAMNASVTLK
jgi:hypothetical protein